MKVLYDWPPKLVNFVEQQLRQQKEQQEPEQERPIFQSFKLHQQKTLLHFKNTFSSALPSLSRVASLHIYALAE